ncbi:lupus La protein homolog A-like [Panonychus citri]|uniref:lupus La protein homolog A-like n=1 Tax=Panonychus citri TaxID=50023 RepID=UPI00230706D0|nr:lupus La protein homolog A-like [Panonychus citri]
MEVKPFEKIANQIKYYFSDFNLTRDKFMQEQLVKNDGWIPLSVLLTFKKLAAITEEPDTVVKAIKSTNSDFIEIDEEGTKIRRSSKFPLPEKTDEYKEEAIKKTLHVKGFPLESSFDELWSYMSSFGRLESLLMRKTKKGVFKGCILAVFKYESDAEKTLNDALNYNGKELLKEKELIHLARRKEYFEKKKKKPQGVKRPLPEDEGDEGDKDDKSQVDVKKRG